MKILFDTNVILDVLLRRQPFHQEALQLFAKVELAEIQGFVGATTVTTLHYLMAKALGAKAARVEIQKILTLFDVALVNRSVLARAVQSKVKDYEDAVLVEAALAAGVDAIVTRDVADFKKAGLTVYSPKELLGVLETL